MIIPSQAIRLLLLAALVALAQAQAPTVPASVTAVTSKYKDDACFKSAVQQDAALLAATLCPPAACASKIDEVITTYINSNDNYYALYGHLLSFQRDMACMAPPKSLNASSTEPAVATCIQQIGSTLGGPKAASLAFFNNWNQPPSSYLRVAANTIDELRRSTPATTACDPSTCANKYLVQWNAWLKSLPDDFIANIPATNPFDKVDVKTAAATLDRDVVAMCKDTKFAVGGLAAQLEVDTKLPRKPAPKVSAGGVSGKGMAGGELVVVVMTWVSVLAVMIYTSTV